jgi:hypothetical protein
VYPHCIATSRKPTDSSIMANSCLWYHRNRCAGFFPQTRRVSRWSISQHREAVSTAERIS